MHFVYLHGFASGPHSRKGRFLQKQLAELGHELLLPDLNAPSFTSLTFSSQLAVLDRTLAGLAGPIGLFGSSLGGLIAVLAAIDDPRIERLILMAPAFRFRERLCFHLGVEAIEQWQRTGKLAFWHHAYRCECNLKADILDDALAYDEERLTRAVPTLILHGRHDEVALSELSCAFAESRPFVQLQLFDTDHGMGDVLPQIWEQVADFLAFEISTAR
ncbi:YqiA/YcfP family alpha/beta fold hydrolase [Gloeobacter kilaueensis]|uniref:Esterase YqiA n=1 Tax=Gloeobacter kilaueensis (strain ATCC BAA-2537 / CCAP 1431/1 / ULC 316 / JS1) TaxID=1183438 RepID=U5QET4_GLOK1|nr:YqiA/YcfP family alpha/beta fold hydrolase [Gloeobacter kilaueensis]AGY57358.1 esterase YqiA [Gloeobacter kilaueensis JS1]